MAWYYGTFSCGHEGRVDIIGPGKDREWKRERAFSGSCPECYRKFKEEERAAANEKAAKESKEMSLPELTGTEKQVAWANTIRLELVSESYDSIRRKCERLSDDGESQEIISDYRAHAVEPIDRYIQAHTDAKFWIEEMRSCSIRGFYDRAKEEFQKYKEEIENLGQTIEEAEQRKTVTVEPEEKLKDGIAKLVTEKDTVKALYRKDSDFMQSVKAMGFKWSGSAWELEITEYTGTADERIADLGNELLNKGFSVQFPDENIKNKAVSGEFEPMNDKWVKWSVKKEKLALCWNGRNDDLYWKAKKLPDAIWHSWMVVPIEYYKEVLDFADINGFNISKTAQEKIAKHKEKESSFEKVNATKVENEQVDKLKEILEKSGAIEDLIDED